MLLEPARLLREQLLAFDARVLNFDQKLAGTVRVTTSDGFATAYLAPHFQAFSIAYPDIVIELAVENRVSDLAEREIDVAIRAAQKLSSNMVGRKAAAMGYSLYASQEYVQRNSGLDATALDFSGHAVCHYHASMDFFNSQMVESLCAQSANRGTQQQSDGHAGNEQGRYVHHCDTLCIGRRG